MLFDTCSKYNIAGDRMYTLYCKTVGRAITLSPLPSSFVPPRWGEVLPALGIGSVRVPIEQIGFLELKVVVVKNDRLPIIIGTDSMNEYRVIIQFNPDKLLFRDLRIPAKLGSSGHFELQGLENLPIYPFTDEELKQLHRRFGHIHAQKLRNLTNAAGEPMTSTEYSKLADIGKACTTCQWYTGRRSSYKVAADVQVDFNAIIAADFMFLNRGDEEQRKVLHIVCLGTKFNQAVFVDELPNNAQSLFLLFFRCWFSIFGAPKRLRVDQESVFVSQDFKTLLLGECCILDPIPVEGHWTNGVVERHHEPLRKVYRRVGQDYSTLADEDILAVAVRCINVSTGPEGLVPSLLVFGTVPRVLLRPENAPHDTRNLQEHRISAALSARAEYERFVSRYNLRVARSSSAPEYPADNQAPITPGTAVLVRRDNSRDWCGPYVCASVSAPNVSVFIPSGFNARARQATYHVNNVKPFQLGTNVEYIDFDECLFHENADAWFQADREEMQGIIKRQTLEPVDDPPTGSVIMGTRLDRVIKQDGRHKSRFIVQGHRDPDKKNLIVEAPVLTKYRFRFLLTLCSLQDSKLFYRDYSQAYLQSVYELKREIYVRLDHSTRTALAEISKHEWPKYARLKKPLYGLSESGAYWFSTLSRTLDSEGFKTSALDACAKYFYSRDGKHVGALGIVVDDVIYFGSESVIHAENQVALLFDNKGISSAPFRFNGFELSQDTSNIQISHSLYAPEMVPETKTFNEFRSLRGQLLYMANGTRPDILCKVSKACCITENQWSPLESKRLATLCKQVQSQPISLVYRKLDVATLRLRVYADASYSNSGASRLGYVIFLGDASDNVLYLHAQSVQARQVTHSVLGAELLALCVAYDVAEALQTEYSCCGYQIPIVLVTDSKCLFDAVARKTILREKRLMVRLLLLRQGLENMNISQLHHVAGSENIADSLTKESREGDRMWYEVLSTGHLAHRYEHSVFLHEMD